MADLGRWAAGQRLMVKDWDMVDTAHGQRVRVRFQDYFPALNALARHVGYFELDHRQESNGLRELVRAISNRSMGLPGEGDGDRE